MAINRVDITKLIFARVRHQDYKFCFFVMMKKNIPEFSDFLVVFRRSCSYIKTVVIVIVINYPFSLEAVECERLLFC